jgi:predicted nucleic acid-binding protein
MITAVDANIILDILTGTPQVGQQAELALRNAKNAGAIVISAVAYAEVAAQFPAKGIADRFFSTISCNVEPLDEESAFLAGRFFDDYKQRGGKRDRILADFLIGAHAQINANRLLTRDDRFFGATFPRLKAVRPQHLI